MWNSIRKLFSSDVYVGNVKFIYNKEANNYKLNSLTVYDNSIKTAEQLANTFFDKGKAIAGCNKTILFAKTQSGKTVVSATACNIIVDRLQQQGYQGKNIDCYYFSNLSSNELRDQNGDDFASTNIDQQCIFVAGHLGNYKKALTKIKDKDSTRPQVIVIDESHIANHKESKFEELITKFENKFDTVLVIYVSATPYSLLAVNYLPGEQKYNVIVYHPGKNYVGLKELLAAGKIKNTKQVIKPYSSVDEKKGLGTKGELYLTDFGKDIIKEYLDNFDKGNKGNLVIRLTGKKADNVEDLIEEYMASLGKFAFTDYTYADVSPTANSGDSKLRSINVAPAKYRIYVIRGAARAGIRIENKNAISMFVESTGDQNDSVVQAGVGRFTGYGSIPNTIIYTNLKSVKTVNEFNSSIFDGNNSNSNTLDLQDWFPSSAHNKPAIKLENQYKITFELLTKEVIQRLKEEKTQFEKVNTDREARFEVRSSGYAERYYDDLELFIRNRIKIHNNYIIASSSPLRKRSFTILYGYLDGPSSRKPEWKERYENVMNFLTSLNVPTKEGSLINKTQPYVLQVEELPAILITNPTQYSDISERMSEKI